MNLENKYEWYDQADMQAPWFSVWIVNQFNIVYPISVENPIVKKGCDHKNFTRSSSHCSGISYVDMTDFYGTKLYLW